MDKHQNINKCYAVDDAGISQCVRRTLCVWSIHKIRQQKIQLQQLLYIIKLLMKLLIKFSMKLLIKFLNGKIYRI